MFSKCEGLKISHVHCARNFLLKKIVEKFDYSPRATHALIFAVLKISPQVTSVAVDKVCV